MSAPTDTTEVTLRNVDLALAREVLFARLSEQAKVLAENAELAAYGGSTDPTDPDNIAGDDAHAQFRHQVQAIAQLLDQIGWSVLGDTAMIVEYERSQKVTSARQRRGQKGGE
jgi:hypothetical protein